MLLYYDVIPLQCLLTHTHWRVYIYNRIWKSPISNSGTGVAWFDIDHGNGTQEREINKT